jgi:hypothetical protein
MDAQHPQADAAVNRTAVDCGPIGADVFHFAAGLRDIRADVAQTGSEHWCIGAGVERTGGGEKAIGVEEKRIGEGVKRIEGDLPKTPFNAKPRR